MARRTRWAVLGGGFLGMTLAHRLAQHGEDVTLVEAAPALGGLASAWQLGDVTWDRHYHVTLLSDAALRTLLAELGLEREMAWVQTRTGFYTEGRLYSMSSTLEFLRFPPLGLVDKLRLALTILRASRIRDGRPLETVPVADWLRRWSGRRTFDKIWLPLLRAKLGESYPRASAAFIWAIIRRMYAARRSGQKTEMFGYVPGGYARILERFGTRLAAEGVRVELGRGATRVEPIPGGGLVVEFKDGLRQAFDRVVATMAAPLAARLCPALSADEQARLRGIEYQGVICASVLLRRPLAGFYVTNITDPVPFTAVIEMSALVDRAQLGGHALVYLPKYVTPDDPAFTLSDDELRRTFLGALARMYPHFREDDVLAFRVSRVKYVLAIATLRYSDRLPPMITSVPGLSIVNSAHIVNGTLNVNETIQLAETAAVRLLAEASAAAPSTAGEPHEAARELVARSR
jgi:protoporphyrinogen oxidase